MQLLGGLLLALVLTAGLEGLDFVSGGEMYLASVRLLAQDSGGAPPPPPPPPSSTPPPTTSPMPSSTGSNQMPPPPPPMLSQPNSSGQYGSQNQGTMPPPPGDRPGMMPPTTAGTRPPMIPLPPYPGDRGLQGPMPPYEGGSGGFMESLPRGGDSGLENGNVKPRMMPPPPGAKPGMMPGEAGPQGNQMGASYQGSSQKMPPPPGAKPGMMPGEGGGMYPPAPPFNPFSSKGDQGGFGDYNSKMMLPPQRGGGMMPPSTNIMKQFGSPEQQEQGGQLDNENFDEEGGTLDPRELSQALSEIKRMLGDVKRLQSQVKKAGLGGDVAQKLADISADLQRFQGILAGTGDSDEKLDAIHEFRNGEYNDAINDIRSMVEIPQEIKKLNQAIKRLEKIIKTKVIKNLGVDLARVNGDIDQMKQVLQTAQNALNVGDYEDVRSALQDLYSEGGPKDIENALFAIRDAKAYLKRLRDADVKSKLEGIIQEAINLANNGDYRGAKEYMEARMAELTS